MDDRQLAPEGKSRKGKKVPNQDVPQVVEKPKRLSETIVGMLRELLDVIVEMSRGSGPAIQPTGVYSASQVRRNLHISKETLAAWIVAGLGSSKPGTKERLFFGDEITTFLRSHRDLSEDPHSDPE